MDFALSSEQRLIGDTAEQFLAKHSASENVRSAMASQLGHDPELWRTVVQDMGWQGVHLPEDCGGLGLGWVELAVVMEAAGRRLLCAPFFSTACLAAPLLVAAASAAQRARWLAPLAEGKTATLAFMGINGQHWDARAANAVAHRDGDGYVLSGELGHVVDGHSAELLLVAARDDDGLLCLFAVPPESTGVARRRLPTMDQTRPLAALRLSEVVVSADQRLGEPGVAAERALERSLALATVALAAEQTGGASQCLEMTVAYTAERHQFSRSIASFQVVKHKCADMMLRVESMRSAAFYAACAADQALAPNAHAVAERGLATAAAVAGSYCSEGFFHCAAEALQLHGGVGFTWEYDVHLYFKRARAAAAMLGTAAQHRERLAALAFDDADDSAAATGAA